MLLWSFCELVRILPFLFFTFGIPSLASPSLPSLQIASNTDANNSACDSDPIPLKFRPNLEKVTGRREETEWKGKVKGGGGGAGSGTFGAEQKLNPARELGVDVPEGKKGEKEEEGEQIQGTLAKWTIELTFGPLLNSENANFHF